MLALGRLGWSLRRIEQSTGVRRETASAYLKQPGSRCAARTARLLRFGCAQPEVSSTDSHLRGAAPERTGRLERWSSIERAHFGHEEYLRLKMLSCMLPALRAARLAWFLIGFHSLENAKTQKSNRSAGRGWRDHSEAARFKVMCLSNLEAARTHTRICPRTNFLRFACIPTETRPEIERMKRTSSRNQGYRRDMRALSAAVTRMVSETLNVPSVTLWVLDEMSFREPSRPLRARQPPLSAGPRRTPSLW